MEVDEAMAKLGFFGRWQISIYFAVFISLQPSIAWNMVLVIFLDHEPPHHCKTPANSSVQEWIPLDSDGELSSCSMFVNSSLSNQTTACVDGWQFDESQSGPTIVTKWDLVCDKAYLPDLALMFFHVGNLLGSFILTTNKLQLGRKWNIILSCFLLAVFGILSVVSGKFWWFVLMRFLVGIFRGTALIEKLVYLAESFSKENKTFYMVIGYGNWSILYSILVLAAYLLENWIKLTLFVSIYPLILIPFAMWWLPKSVRWLHANNKIEEAEQVLLRAAKMNNVTFTRPILKPVEMQGKKSENIRNNSEESVEDKTLLKTRYSVLELFRNRYLLRHMSLGLVIWVANFSFLALNYISDSFTKNRYLSIFLNLCIELPVCILVYFIIKRVGNKKTVITFFFMASLSMFICLLVAAFGDKDNEKVQYARMAMTVCAKFFVGGVYPIIFIYGSEIFPTNLRRQATGICVFVGRFGSIFASYASYIFSLYPKQLYAFIVVVNLLGGFLCLLFPETFQRALPETIEDVEAWYQKDAVDTKESTIGDYEQLSEEEDF